jgi:hypothetical protein
VRNTLKPVDQLEPPHELEMPCHASPIKQGEDKNGEQAT